MVSLQRGPADPAEPPRRSCTQPSHPGPPSSDQTTWTYQPEAQAPRGSLLDSVPLPKGGGWCLRQRDVTFGERHISFMSLQGTRINPWTPKKSPRSQPPRGPQLGPSEGSVVLPTSLGRGSHLPISSTPGCYWEKGCWHIPLVQHTCVNPHSPLQPSHSRQPLPRLLRAHAGLIGHLPAALAASASPAPTPCSLPGRQHL